jgi:hypothetical protein
MRRGALALAAAFLPAAGLAVLPGAATPSPAPCIAAQTAKPEGSRPRSAAAILSSTSRGTWTSS